MDIKDLEVYRLSREISKISWDIYSNLPRSEKFSLGSQLIMAADSVGANIAEGFGRYHYLDTAKFYYNARGSLIELRHWIELVNERNLYPELEFQVVERRIINLGVKLNNLITKTKSKAININRLST